MRVVLLGAGASKSYSQSPTEIRMPLALDFWDTFLKLKGNNHPWIVAEWLITYIKDVMRLSPDEFLGANMDIEEFHSQIEASVRSAIERGDTLARVTSFGAFNELVFLFAYVINQIQNGPLSEAHLKLARCLSSDDVVVTFNWDTLMDRALAHGTKWTIDTGYGIIPRAIFSNGWRNVDLDENVASQIAKTTWLNQLANELFRN